MKRIIILLTLVSATFVASAQNNRFELSVGGHRFKNVIEQNNKPNSRLILGYQRAITSKLSLDLRVSITTLAYLFGPNIVAGQNVTNPELIYTSHPGLETYNFIERRRYRYFDLGVQYKFLSIHHNDLSLELAPSFATGKNSYQELTVFPNLIRCGTVNETAFKRENYYGAAATLHYNYLFPKKHLNLGGDFGARIYNHDFPFQINYSIHVGYNF